MYNICRTVGTCTTEQCDDTRGTYYKSGAECTTEGCTNTLGANEEYALGWTTSAARCGVACVDGYVRKDNECTEDSSDDIAGAAAYDADLALIVGVAGGALALKGLVH